MNKLRYTNTI